MRFAFLFVLVLLAVTLAAPAAERPLVTDAPGQAIAGPAALVHPDSRPVEDPFPIRRLHATEAQLPGVLKQLEAGPLVRLPRGEFEARVRAAGRAVAEARNLPRIADARYKAALTGVDLVGTAELELVSTGAASHFLPLDPLRLALGPATWGDGKEAVVGIPPGTNTAGVWVDRPGRQTLKFGWSLAGITEPGERQFELRVPATPTAMLELELPANQVPTVPVADVLLTGPFPVPGDPPRALWRFRFGGRSKLDFAVRPAGNPGVAATAALKATYDLTPGQVSCSFEYDLRPAKGTVGEWEFTVDPGLRITDVVMNSRAAWTVDAAAGPGVSRRLRVTLRQPGAGGKVVIAAVAPFPDPSRPNERSLPMVRPAGPDLDEETLDVRLAPGCKFDHWNSGDYRLINSQLLSDQTRVLMLEGTLLPPGQDRPFRRPPAAHVSVAEADFTVTEQTAWRFEADRATATVRVKVQVRRGPLFQLGLRFPAGYSFTRVTATPGELVSFAGSTGGTVTAEFARPLATGQSAELMFEFRGPGLPYGTHRLAFPAFTPLGAAERVGVLGIFPGAFWSAEIQPGVGAVAAGWFDPMPPLVPAGAEFAYRYRSGDPDGTAKLTPAKPGFTVDAATRIARTPEGETATSTFALRVQKGALTSVVVTEAPEWFENRTWRVVGSGNAVISATPLPVNAILWPFLRFDLLRERLWLVRFARPVTGEVVLETTTTVPPGTSAEELRRLNMCGASAFRIVAAPDAKPAGSPSPRAWSFGGVYLVTAVRSPSDVVVVFGGTIASAGDAVLPIALPAGAEVRAANVGGRWLEPGAWRATASAGGVAVKLPVSATGPVRFEVRYRLPVEAGRVTSRVQSLEPTLPASGIDVQRRWAFASDVLPGGPVRGWDHGAAGDMPELLGDPIAAALVFRSPLAEVEVASAHMATAAGLAIAVVLLLLAWVGARRQHPLAGVLVVAGLLALGVMARLAPPWWQHAATVPLIFGLLAAAGLVLARGHRLRLPAAAVAVIFAFTLAGTETVAQPVAPATVVLLPVDAMGREIVVAPKSVLDRLAVRPMPPAVIITAADYAVMADDMTARVTAKFVAHALDETAPVATLPLADARLERVTVNGTAAFPAAVRPGVYTVPLTGKGRHEIEVRFAVPVLGTGTERDIRFGVPDVPATKVTADIPGSAQQVQVVGRFGRLTATTGQRVRLEVEAGALKQVQLRWRDGAGGSAAIMRVREGCIWDVTEAGAKLTACYLVRVEQGTVTALRFELPPELEPLGVTVQGLVDPLRPLDPIPVVALRDWSHGPEQNGTRPLRLDFQGPTAGRILVVLTLDPRKALTRHPLLRFPRFVNPSGPTEPDAAYGLRVKNVVIENQSHNGMIDYSPEALTRDFADVKALRLQDASLPQVRVFRPTPTGTPELRLSLHASGESPGVSLDTSWQFGLHRADATGTIQWSGKDAAPLIEFTLAGGKVTEIRGANVSAWSQSGGRVQVWLRKPAKEGEFAWSATVTPALPFEPPTPRVIDARLVTDTVRIQPAAGFALTIERDRGWTHATGTATVYQTTNPMSPPLRIAIQPVPLTLRIDELGWLSPRPKPAPSTTNPKPSPPAPEDRSRSEKTPIAPAEKSTETASRWVGVAAVVAAWCAVALVLAVLLARFPRTTWPEQFALVAALFGAAVAGGWWVGVAAWVTARVAWLIEVAVRPQASSTH